MIDRIDSLATQINSMLVWELPYLYSDGDLPEALLVQGKWALLDLVSDTLKRLSRLGKDELIVTTVENMLQNTAFRWGKEDSSFMRDLAWDFSVTISGIANYLFMKYECLWSNDSNCIQLEISFGGSTNKKQSLMYVPIRLFRIIESSLKSITIETVGLKLIWSIYERTLQYKETDRFGWVHWEIDIPERKSSLVRTWYSFARMCVLLLMDNYHLIDKYEHRFATWIASRSNGSEIEMALNEASTLKKEYYDDKEVEYKYGVNFTHLKSIIRILEQAKRIHGHERLQEFLKSRPDVNLYATFQKQVYIGWRNQSIIRKLCINANRYNDVSELNVSPIRMNTVINRDIFWKDTPYGVPNRFGIELGRLFARHETTYILSKIISNTKQTYRYDSISQEEIRRTILSGFQRIRKEESDKLVMLTFGVRASLLGVNKGDNGSQPKSLPEGLGYYMYQGYDAYLMNIPTDIPMILCLNINKLNWIQKKQDPLSEETVGEYLIVSKSLIKDDEEAEEAYQRSKKTIDNLMGEPESIEQKKDIFRRISVEESVEIRMKDQCSLQITIAEDESGFPSITKT